MSVFKCNIQNRICKTMDLNGIHFSLAPGQVLGVYGDKHSGIEYISELFSDCSVAVISSCCPFCMTMTVQENADLFGGGYNTWQQDVFEQECQNWNLGRSKKIKDLSKLEQVLVQLIFAISCGAKTIVLDQIEEWNTEQVADMYQYLVDAVKNKKLNGNQLPKKQTLSHKKEQFKKNSMIEHLIIVSKKIELLSMYCDTFLWLDHGTQLVYRDIKTMLDEYRILSGSEKQLQYLLENNLDSILITKIYPNGGEVLMKGTETDVDLLLDSRVPTLSELFTYQEEYKKANHKYMIATDVKQQSDEITLEPKPSVVNMAAVKKRNSEPKEKQWKKVSFEDGKRKTKNDLWDEPQEETREKFESPFE